MFWFAGDAGLLPKLAGGDDRELEWGELLNARMVGKSVSPPRELQSSIQLCVHFRILVLGQWVPAAIPLSPPEHSVVLGWKECRVEKGSGIIVQELFRVESLFGKRY